MSSEFQIPDFMKEVVRFTNSVCAPIAWHRVDDTTKTPFPGGSCFFLRFSDRIVGVTANHVITAYHGARVKAPQLPFQISKLTFDIDAALIDRDDSLDLATFGISETQVQITDAATIDCRGAWPPPLPKINSVLSLAGFPEESRTIATSGRIEFRMYSALPMVDGLSDTEIIVTHEQSRDKAAMDFLPSPPPRFNMSGCSGGPVLMHGTLNGIHRWFAVGAIVQGPGGIASGEAEDFEMIRIRRIDCINNDGTINRLGSGWLPPRTFVDPRD